MRRGATCARARPASKANSEAKSKLERLLWIISHFDGAIAEDGRFLYYQELLACLVLAESVKALRGKQITPYL